MKKQKLKFAGTLDELKTILRDHDIRGDMTERPGFHRFETNNGACLHWYANGTICFQGPEMARRELEEKLDGVFDGTVRMVPDASVEPELAPPAPTPDLTGLMPCGDCGALPGQAHNAGCDIEVCSVCGEQRLFDACRGHDKQFARWTGFWPGEPEAKLLGIDLNEFHRRGFHKVLFIKPKRPNRMGG